MKRRAAQRGVTLIELLIALFVFALISSAGVYALRLAVEGSEQLERSEAVLREWRLARLIIREDMAQLAPRIVRDEFGQSQGAAFFGGVAIAARAPIAGEELLAGFVRRGWANPNDAMPRSTLQYVEYVLKDGDIIRRSRPYLDDARNQPRNDRVLFFDVENVQFQFFAGETREGLQWSDIWPAPGAGGFAPRAVRLSFESVRFGPIEQLFWIGDLHHPGPSAST
jgi:general secretion pathway protein J